MTEPPIAFLLPCAACKTEVVASIALLRHARGFKCRSCAQWTDIDAASVNALETDFEKSMPQLRRRLEAA
jgi:hypothetical protein